MVKIMRLFLIVGLSLASAACAATQGRDEAVKAAAETSPSTSASAVASNAFPTGLQSVYSELSGPPCSREKETGTVTSEHTCPGVARYRLIITNVDERQSVTVVTPENRQVALGLNGICNGGFCSVGQKAEWRVVEKNGQLNPIALIVRVNCQSGSAKTVSYLSVSKITEREICLTDHIPPGSNANVKARVAADSSANKPCIQSP